MRNHYWTIGKFADWLRGTPSPGASTSEEWDEWNNNAQSKHPVRYWLTEEGIDYVQDFVFYIPDTIHAVKYYINNRWITRAHALTANPRDIKPGTWHDLGYRFLPCLFNELQNYVEIELAWWHLAWSPKERPKYKMPWWAVGWWRVRTWRCPQAGLDNLAWQSSLKYDDEWIDKDDPKFGKPTQQAVNAQEIVALYKWWTEVYRNRPDPYEASGWHAYCEASRLANGGKLSFSTSKDAKLKKASDKVHKLLQKIEADYEKEDEAMMIRLIKIRQSLWT